MICPVTQLAALLVTHSTASAMSWIGEQIRVRWGEIREIRRRLQSHLRSAQPAHEGSLEHAALALGAEGLPLRL